MISLFGVSKIRAESEVLKIIINQSYKLYYLFYKFSTYTIIRNDIFII